MQERQFLSPRIPDPTFLLSSPHTPPLWGSDDAEAGQTGSIPPPSGETDFGGIRAPDWPRLGNLLTTLRALGGGASEAVGGVGGGKLGFIFRKPRLLRGRSSPTRSREESIMSKFARQLQRKNFHPTPLLLAAAALYVMKPYYKYSRTHFLRF